MLLETDIGTSVQVALVNGMVLRGKVVELTGVDLERGLIAVMLVEDEHGSMRVWDIDMEAIVAVARKISSVEAKRLKEIERKAVDRGGNEEA